MTLYMKVTNDEYELPLAVGTVNEIAKMQGITPHEIYRAIWRAKNGIYKRPKAKYVKVEVDE